MEREPRPRTLKLADAASEDYPAASEILVSFPDRWELVQPISLGDTLLYLAAMPPSQEWARRDRFHGLAPEINLELTAYRLYSFFQPWPIPSVIVSWDEATGTGRVERMGDLKMQLRPVGQAQIWKGPAYGVLWECYFRHKPTLDQPLRLSVPHPPLCGSVARVHPHFRPWWRLIDHDNCLELYEGGRYGCDDETAFHRVGAGLQGRTPRRRRSGRWSRLQRGWSRCQVLALRHTGRRG
jgi:hypothetical protein